MVNIADRDIVEVVRLGKDEAMPAQDGKLTDEEMLAVAAFVRSFSSTQGDPSQATTAEPANTFDITGTVTNGTAGASVPTDFTVNLGYGNPTDGITQLTAPLAADGTYQFNDVPLVADSAYYVYALYQGQPFEGLVAETADITGDLTVPITLYEFGDDPTVIRIKQLTTQLEPFEMEDDSMGAGLLVTQKYTFENTSDRAFLLSQAGQTFSLLMVMPPGSVALNVTRDERFLVAAEQFAVIYLESVKPGDTTLDLIYFLPYSDGAIFDQPLNYPYEGTTTLTINPKAVRVKDEGWTFDDSAPFVNQYTRTVNIAGGEAFKFELVGDVNATTSTNPTLVTGDLLVPIIAGVVIVVSLIVLGLGFLRRRNPDTEIQTLLRQIADLDAMHEHGQVNHDAYQRQRKALKDRLTVLMVGRKEEKPPST
jgi:hypothetical protein